MLKPHPSNPSTKACVFCAREDGAEKVTWLPGILDGIDRHFYIHPRCAVSLGRGGARRMRELGMDQ